MPSPLHEVLVQIFRARPSLALELAKGRSELALTWAASRIFLGPSDGGIQPLVLGPEEIPAIRDPERAKAQPDLALLSAMTYSHGPLAREVARAASIAIDGFVDEEKQKLYTNLIQEALGEKRAAMLGVLAVLAARRLALSQAERERVLACREFALLDRWIARAVTVASAAELFAT